MHHLYLNLLLICTINKCINHAPKFVGTTSHTPRISSHKEKPLEKEILGVCEVAPTPPLNITIVKIKYGYRQGGHVRYANTKDTLK
jgi:hypothetical protein